jgi:P4 family phage/plasmid primase-like protien
VRDEANGQFQPKPDKNRALGEWRATGNQTVIHGTHPGTGRPYRREVDKPPVRIRFEDIHWPEGLHLPWLPPAPPPVSPEEADAAEQAALEKAYGQPYEKSQKGKITMNQTFFAAYYHARHKVIFAPEEEHFFRYEGPKTGLWSKQTSDNVRKELAADIKAFGDFNGEPKLAFQCTTTLESAIASKIRGFAEEWNAFFRPLSPITNRPRALVHLKNAMLDLDQSPPVMVPFAPEHRSRNQLLVDLNPDAQCPRFLKELLEPALHPDDVRLLRKVAGQIILGVNLAQKICILTGLEGRGKSTFVKVMQRVIGEVNCGELRTKHLAERFEVFRMLGKSLLVGNDVPGNFMMIDGAEVLKSLVGGDLKDAEPKNGNEGYRVRGEFNILITCNTRLRVKLDGDAGAWRRRLLLLPYESPPPKRKDPLFVEKLVASEASGILNWMIAGAVDLLADIEEFGDIQLTSAQKDRVESLLAESDSVRDFVRRGCAKAPHKETATSEAIAAAYVAYCERRGWAPMPSKVVERVLPDALLEIHQASKSNDIKSTPLDKAKRGYRGVRIVALGELNDRENEAVASTEQASDSEPSSAPAHARSASLDQSGVSAPPPSSSPSREQGTDHDEGIT